MFTLFVKNVHKVTLPWTNSRTIGDACGRKLYVFWQERETEEGAPIVCLLTGEEAFIIKMNTFLL